METVNCNLCGSAKYRTIYQKPDTVYFPEEIFTVVECEECGLGFVNPRPTEDEIWKYYPSDFYDVLIDRMETKSRPIREAAYLRDLVGPDRAVLDVGCGNGGFLKHMKSLGWEVEGQEIGTNSKSIDEFKVHRVPFTQLDVGAKRYDAVTMWAVLEHVHDPMSHIQKAGAVLKGGGRLIICSPNFDSLISRRLLGEDIPRHLYFFSERTIRKYLEINGFYVVNVRYGSDVFSLDPHNLVFYLLHKLRDRGKFDACHMKKSRWDFFSEHRLNPGVASTLRYCARHPVAALDTALAPLIGRIEQLLGSYGNVTYVARKRESSRRVLSK